MRRRLSLGMGLHAAQVLVEGVLSPLRTFGNVSMLIAHESRSSSDLVFMC